MDRRHVAHSDHIPDRTVISIRDGAGRQQEDYCPLVVPTQRLARPTKRGSPLHDPRRRGVNGAPGMRRKQGDRRRIVQLAVTVGDVPQKEHQGGQRHKQHGWPWVVQFPSVVPIPAYHIRITGSGLPGGLGGLFAAHRVYHTMSQGTGHPRLEDRLESREPYVVQLGGPNPRVTKVQMVLVTLPELNGPVPRLVARGPCM